MTIPNQKIPKNRDYFSIFVRKFRVFSCIFLVIYSCDNFVFFPPILYFVFCILSRSNFFFIFIYFVFFCIFLCQPANFSSPRKFFLPIKSRSILVKDRPFFDKILCHNYRNFFLNNTTLILPKNFQEIFSITFKIFKLFSVSFLISFSFCQICQLISVIFT